jgi:cell division control protein 6
LVGREEERAVLKTFIQTGIDSKSGRCLYVSGPPGTGKSALVSEVSKEFEGAEGVRSAYINCMSIKNSQDMYEKLVGELCGDDYSMESDAITTLKTIFLSKKGSHGMFVVTLDEIDHLLTLDLEILYTLFEWALTRSPRLILVGIANALDLTDRFLPRLKARNLAPQLLPFLPYTVPQIASVITTKLNTLLPANSATPDFTPVLHPAAIQFCAKKIATQAGDLRKAFDIVRRSIDLIETETKAKHQREADSQAQASPTKPLGENANLASPRPTLPTVTTPSEFLGRLTAETAPRATIAHVARITALAFSNGTAQRLQSLNLQQKAALCALVSVERKTTQLGRDLFSTPSKSANAVPTIRKAYDTYRALCRRDNALHPLTATEFADVIGSLETVSLVRGGDGKSVMGMGLGRLTPSKKVLRPEDRRVISCVSEKEVEGCLEGAGGAILRGLLRGD